MSDLQIDIMTLFPDACDAMMSESIIGRARRDGKLTVNYHQIRDYTKNKQKQVDDYPYGGGMDMVMYADALYNCWAAIKENCPDAHTIYMSPQGSVFNQERQKNSQANTLTSFSFAVTTRVSTSVL